MSANQATRLPGTVIFFCNRAGAHNWLDNNARPMMSVVHTDETGHPTYADCFLNPNSGVSVRETKEKLIISFPKHTNQPLWRRLDRPQSRSA